MGARERIEAAKASGGRRASGKGPGGDETGPVAESQR